MDVGGSAFKMIEKYILVKAPTPIHFEKMMETLRSGGMFIVDGTGDVHFTEG